LQASDPELWVLDEDLLEPSGRPPALVWWVIVTGRNGEPIREYVFVDAQRGSIRVHWNQVDSSWASLAGGHLLQAETETPSETPLATETLVPTDTPTEVSSDTPLPTDVSSETPTETPLPSETPSPTDTSVPTETPTVTETVTAAPTAIWGFQ
jgi:hypothetical protein